MHSVSAIRHVLDDRGGSALTGSSRAQLKEYPRQNRTLPLIKSI